MRSPTKQVSESQPGTAKLVVEPDAEVVQRYSCCQTSPYTAELVGPLPVKAEGVEEFDVNTLDDLAEGGAMLDTTTEAGGRAERRLREEESAWLTTIRADGQPQSVPVWFLWNDESFLIYSQPGRQKLRNITNNPRIGLNLNSNAHGGDVVRVEGMADVVEDALPATEVPEYVEKYRAVMARIGFDPEGFAQAYSVLLRVTPTHWQVW